MKPKPARSDSLADAHERIAGLLDELNETVDLVERLTSAGEHEAALRLVEAQRAALYSTVDGISHVGVKSSRWEVMRRNATSMVAAAALLLSGLAVSVGVLTRGPTAVEQARAGLTQARGIADPVERLRIIERVVRITQTLPADSQTRGDLADDVLDQLDDITNPSPEGDGEVTPPDPDLVAEANDLARQVQDGEAPSTSPPSEGKSPLEGLTDTADGVDQPGG